MSRRIKGKIRQVGSLIDGNFTLNSGGYEHEDLKDVDKSRNIGINMTFTPGVTEIYRNGRMTGEATGGVAVGTRLNYSETNYVAKVKATVGEATGITVNGKSTDLSGINRDVSNMVEVEKDKKILPMNIDLGTEYWLNDYSREKLKTAEAEIESHALVGGDPYSFRAGRILFAYAGDQRRTCSGISIC